MSASTFYDVFQLEKYGNILKPTDSVHSIEDIEAKSDIEDWMNKEAELSTIEAGHEHK